ncbi:MAG TPA: hypothetical protein VFV33_15015, partial [Gemmatimonadaceae bacterium]|nr:hypothetical protein [Gemmatimonadaceae bacterium]
MIVPVVARGLIVSLLELRTRLNASEIVSSFTTDLRATASSLDGVSAPIDANGVRDIAGAASVDLSALTRAAQRIAAELGASPIALPDPGALVGQLESLLALLEEIDLRGVDTAVRALLDQARSAIVANGGSRVDVLLEQLAATLGASPQGRQVLGLLSRIVSLVGGDARYVDDFKALLPAALSILRALGGLMRVESALSEGERLARLLRAQLAREETLAELQMVEASLDYAVDRL